MSVRKETIVYCDGGEPCPRLDAYGSGDCREQTAKQQRSGFIISGWLHRRGKDYCPACAKRLFAPSADVSGEEKAE